MKKSRFKESQIFQVFKEAEAGVAVAELCRKYCMSTASFYKWRAKYGGMDVSNMKRQKELGAENARLKKMYAEEKLTKKVVKPSRRKEMAQRAVSDKGVSIRLVCRASVFPRPVIAIRRSSASPVGGGMINSSHESRR